MNVTDQQLEELAERLGESAADKIDVERTAAAVLERLRETPNDVEVGWRSHYPVFGAVAAAAAVVLAVGILSSNPEIQLGNGFRLAQESATLQVMSIEELEEMYDSLSFEAPVAELAAASFEDMNIGQLEELLETLMED